MIKRVKPLKPFLEKDFQKQIFKAFSGHPNILLFRRNVGATEALNPKTGKKRFLQFAEAGQSDIWGIVAEYRCPKCNKKQHGVHLEIELKLLRTGKLSPLQELWIQKVSQYNGIAFVLWLGDDDFLRVGSMVEKNIERSICPECVGRQMLIV